MESAQTEYRRRLQITAERWIADGLPSRQAVEAEADTLERWKTAHGVCGLWPDSPSMLTATLDDGIGQGLEVIERFGSLAGLTVVPLGLLQTSDAIIAACRRHRPDLLGLTVLHLDSEEMLARIGRDLPAGIRWVAGGPVFRFDPELTDRCGIDYAAANVAYFLRYLLNFHPG